MRLLRVCAPLILCGKEEIASGKAWGALLGGDIRGHVDVVWYGESLCDMVTCLLTAAGNGFDSC